MYTKVHFSIALLMVVVSSPVLPAQITNDECLVPCDEIISGGVRIDGIPALSDPEKTPADEGDLWLFDEDIVLGVERNGVACAYPLAVFFWHEIVNDDFGDDRSVITYCPLTGTGMHFDAAISAGRSDFGVSGKLRLNNLILYNRTGETSYWGQINQTSIVGPLKGEQLTRLPLIETSWSTWKTLHPDTTVLSNRTGFARDYSRYPYGDYENIDEPPLFSNKSIYHDTTFPPKLRVLGIEGDAANTKAYPFSELQNMPVVNDVLDNQTVLVVYHDESRMAAAFHRVVDTQELSFQREESDSILPYALVDDQTRTKWNLAGRAVEGPLKGKQLEIRSDGLIAFWFAWAAFHPNPELFNASGFQTPTTEPEPAAITNWNLYTSTHQTVEMVQ